MKINCETKQPEFTFDDIEIGECFKLPKGTFHYLKINPVYGNDDEVLCNAVFLEDGEITSFNDNQEVTPVEAEITIK